MMTIGVYKVDKDGRKTETVPRYEVEPGDPERLQENAIGYPPCACSQCRTRNAAR